jgi:predicted PurR-regulated permease PerM
MDNVSTLPTPDRSGELRFAKRVLIVLGLLSLAYFTYLVSTVLLLVFAAVLLAVVFHAVADLIHRYLRLGRKWALGASVLIIILVLAALGYAFGTLITSQFRAVAEGLPQAVDNFGSLLGVEGASKKLDETMRDSVNATSILPRAADAGYLVVGALANMVLVAVASIYFASDPGLYKGGVAKLFPRERHEMVVDTMDTVGNALRLWLVGQFIVMLLVGTLSGLGYWWLGLPAPLALGFIAGVTNFVPFLGPILGAAPAIIFAFNMDMNTVLWTLGVALAVQQIEGDVITPLVQRRTVSLPPALALFAIVICGIVFGVLGVLLAAPITVAVFVVIKKLYVREALGRTTEVPGEGEEAAS